MNNMKNISMLEGRRICLSGESLRFEILLISGGKQRSKIEVELNSQRHDTGGDTRKIVTAMANNEKNRLHGHK
jgi:hypothetical protein